WVPLGRSLAKARESAFRCGFWIHLHSRLRAVALALRGNQAATCVSAGDAAFFCVLRTRIIAMATTSHTKTETALISAKLRRSKASCVPVKTRSAESASPARAKKLSMANFALYLAWRLVRRNNA